MCVQQYTLFFYLIKITQVKRLYAQGEFIEFLIFAL